MYNNVARKIVTIVYMRDKWVNPVDKETKVYYEIKMRKNGFSNSFESSQFNSYDDQSIGSFITTITRIQLALSRHYISAKFYSLGGS